MPVHHTPAYIIEAKIRLRQRTLKEHSRVERIAADKDREKAIQVLSILLLREIHNRNYHVYEIEIEREANRKGHQKSQLASTERDQESEAQPA